MDDYKLYVSGMSCEGCANSVRSILSNELALDEEDIEVSIDNGTAVIASDEPFNEDSDRLAAALYALKKQGFPAQRFQE
ncbi:MAG: heavy-metal-associated domain-containing protein [Persicimonas sp.]